MSWDEISDSVCPIAQSLLIVGDRWTMLILRELAMGMHRFDELQAQTGMSSHLLTLRLKRLEHDGIIERRLYMERPPRYEYHTTPMGKELDPLLMMLRTWGRKWVGDCPEGEPAVALVHRASGIELDDLWQIPQGGRDFTFDDVDPSIGPTFAAERERRRAAFYSDTPVSKVRQAGAKLKAVAKKAATAAAKTTVAPKTKTVAKIATPSRTPEKKSARPAGTTSPLKKSAAKTSVLKTPSKAGATVTAKTAPKAVAKTAGKTRRLA